MEALNIYIALLMCVASYPHCSHGSTTEVTRALNIGDDLTLDCLTEWDPNIDLYWLQKPRQSQYRYIAKAGRNFPNGEISAYFLNNTRISYSYYGFENNSTNEKKVNFALHISNLSKQDSGVYTCSLTIVNAENVYSYDISVIICNCSIDTNVNCDLLGFNSARWLPVSISFKGRNTETVVRGSSFSFSTSHLSDLIKHYSIRVSSSDGVFSNIRCTLPHQWSPSSTSKTTTVFVNPSSSSEHMITRITTDPKEFASTTLTTLSEKHVSTISTGLKSFVSHTSLSPMGANVSVAPPESHPTSTTDTTEKPLTSTKEKMQLASVLKTLTPMVTDSVHSSAVTQDRNKSLIPSVMTGSSEFWTTQTDFKSTPQSAEFKNNMIIIVISIGISAGVIILVVIIVIQTRGRNYKLKNVRGKNKLRRGQEKSPRSSLKLQTRSTTIPDFTFQNNAMKTCYLHDEESTDDHYYSSVIDFNNRQNGMPTDNSDGRNLNSRDAVESSDYRVDLSHKESAKNIKHTRKVIPMEELKNFNGQETTDTHFYYALENDDNTHCFPNQDPCTSSCSRYEASGEVFVDNILYESSDVIPMKTTTGPSEHKADDAHLYFFLEDNSEQSCSSDNECSTLPLFNSHQNKDPDRRLSGHLYEDIDSRFRKECTK